MRPLPIRGGIERPTVLGTVDGVSVPPRKNAVTVKAGRRRPHRAHAVGATALGGTTLAFERQRPGKGYRHVLRKADIERFIALLPDWDELSRGLDAIVLLPGHPENEGWCSDDGWIGICAWDRALWHRYHRSWTEHPRDSMARLDVPFELVDGQMIAKWTEETVRGYQLLDVLLHELGHHRDRMSTRSRAHATRGEKYAEQYAARHGNQIWDAYTREFGTLH
jgi:hypothetical protein